MRATALGLIGVFPTCVGMNRLDDIVLLAAAIAAAVVLLDAVIAAALASMAPDASLFRACT